MEMFECIFGNKCHLVSFHLGSNTQETYYCCSVFSTYLLTAGICYVLLLNCLKISDATNHSKCQSGNTKENRWMYSRQNRLETGRS